MKKLLLLLLFVTSPAFARPITITPNHVYDITRTGHQLWAINTLLTIPTEAFNSYFCKGIGARADDIFSFNPSQTNTSLAKFRSLSSSNQLFSKSAFSFITNSASTYEVQIEGNAFNHQLDTYGSIVCEETTLYGSFNTIAAANPINFLELTNIDGLDNDPILVRIHLTSFTGVSFHSFEVSISPRERRDIAIHDMPGAADTFGSIFITHDGKPDTLRANISKYLIENGILRITATEKIQKNK
jgi:hypothetical protein